MSAALITVCNEALALIAKGAIQSLTEPSIEARECNRFAPSLLEEMADWTEWPQQIKRGVLAPVTNDRPAEWLFAYAQPSDMADPIAIRSVENDATSLPIATYGTLPRQDAFPLRFIIEGGVVYTNVETATLVYTKSDLSAAEFTPAMRRAFREELAARLAMPVSKDRKMAEMYAAKAEMSRARAIADAENKSPRSQIEYISEAELAREGIEL